MCDLFTFVPPIIPLIYVSGHDWSSNALLNLNASLSFLLWMYMNSKITCSINKKSAKLTSYSQYTSSPTHLMIFYNKLNSGSCLSVHSVNVNKSWKVNIFLLSKTIYASPHNKYNLKYLNMKNMFLSPYKSWTWPPNIPWCSLTSGLLTQICIWARSFLVVLIYYAKHNEYNTFYCQPFHV